MPALNLTLFVDASFNPKLKVGIGGYMCAPNPDNGKEHHIKTIVVENTTNTRLELQSLIWAMESIEIEYKNIEMNLVVYTDCQSAVNLKNRRKKLESSHFKSKKKVELKNADIYRLFFQLYDVLHPELVWVKGHMPKLKQTQINRNFARVDKYVRKELRTYLGKL